MGHPMDLAWTLRKFDVPFNSVMPYLILQEKGLTHELGHRTH
jgi:hypothetical protein